MQPIGLTYRATISHQKGTLFSSGRIKYLPSVFIAQRKIIVLQLYQLLSVYTVTAP
jgi:hypothetical protein